MRPCSIFQADYTTLPLFLCGAPKLGIFHGYCHDQLYSRKHYFPAWCSYRNAKKPHQKPFFSGR
jgi:hypothetical protein